MDRGLDEREIQKCIRDMLAFMEVALKETLQAIEYEMEEAYTITKNRLVAEGKTQLRNKFDKMETRLQEGSQLYKNVLKHRVHLEMQNARDKAFWQVLEEVRQRLLKINENQTMYFKIMEKLLLQGLLMMQESVVVVCCLETDEPLVRTLLSSTSQQFSSLVPTRHVELILNTQTHLDLRVLGGMRLYSPGGRVSTDVTLADRLIQAAHFLQPTARQILFGDHQHRSHS